MKRHIIRKHKTKHDVQEILCKPSSIQNAFFDNKRRERIYSYNINLISRDKKPEMRERFATGEDQLRVFFECKGFFSNRYFSKHRCSSERPEPFKPKHLQKLYNDKIESDEEFTDILNRFRGDRVGDHCRSNYYMKLIGFRPCLINSVFKGPPPSLNFTLTHRLKHKHISEKKLQSVFASQKIF